MPVKRISDTQMEIREGGGCLSIFGLPFLAAGVFMLLVTAGLIPLQNASDPGVWLRPILAAMGLIFTAVGGWLVFGRTRVLIDTAQGCLKRQRSLLFFSLQRQSFDLKTFRAVELGFEAGDSDSADTYPVTLINTDAVAPLRISSSVDYAASLEQARQSALFLKLPLEDATSDHRTVLPADDVDKPLAERLRASRDDQWAVRPITMRSTVDILPARLQVTIPRDRFRLIMLLPAIIPLAILYYVLPGLIDFFYRTHTPEYVQWFFLGFILLMFGFFPALSVINAVIYRLRGYTGVLIAEGRIQITEQRAWRRKVIALEAADMMGLDYETVQSRSERAATEIQNRKMKNSALQAEMPPRPLPGWVSTLSRLGKSKGVTIKHRQGLYTFGAGLPDDEVKYLYSLVRRALMERPRDFR